MGVGMSMQSYHQLESVKSKSLHIHIYIPKNQLHAELGEGTASDHYIAM